MKETEIREMIKREFKDHKANIVVETDEVTVMDWKRDSTRSYSIRYISTQNHLCITGDLGSGVLDLTWIPKFTDDWKLHIDYFIEKIRASDSGEFTWSSDDALNDLEDCKKDHDSYYGMRLSEETITTIEEAISSGAEYCGMNGHNEYVRYLAESLQEWERYDEFGKRIPIRHWYWLIGLQMASAYLNAK